MNSIDIYVVVEGQTEQTFIRDLLAPYMAQKRIYLHPALIGMPGHKGGDIHFERATYDIGNFLKQRNDTYITTMFDYYGIDSQWPGKEKVHQQIQNGISLTAVQKAEILENAAYYEIKELFSTFNAGNRFIPYIEMHEFEALLFSDTKILAEKIKIDVMQIEAILEKCNNPEEINDNSKKAPSKRLVSLKKGYRKVAHGRMIYEAIGIQTMRAKCSHFNQWLTRLENLK